MTDDHVAIDPQLPLRKAPKRPIGVSVPAPLSKRLDLLVEMLEEAGHRAYRNDLMAALILSAPEDEDSLAELLIRYRKALAQEAGIATQPSAEVLELRPDKPGRRPRSG